MYSNLMALVGTMRQHLNWLEIDIPGIKVITLDMQVLLALQLEMVYGFSLGKFRDEGDFRSWDIMVCNCGFKLEVPRQILIFNFFKYFNFTFWGCSSIREPIFSLIKNLE